MRRRRRPATEAEAGFEARLAAAIAALPRGLRTRFAPAPTGHLHLGHVANALVTWRVARATGGSVVLRIEDHDRQRCRPEFEAALLDDLEDLGFVPDEPPIAWFRDRRPSPWRQSDNDRTYATAIAQLRDQGLVYACDCSRATLAGRAASGGEGGTGGGREWRGPGCPGGCVSRGLPLDVAGVAWRVDLGGGSEAWHDLALGDQAGDVAPAGDMSVRDRHGNWTYALCVVVDDFRHEIELVIRGEDLRDATPAQIRLGALLGRAAPPRFLHHPLILRPDGRKLSKADGATSIRELLAGGMPADALRGRASAALGLATGR